MSFFADQQTLDDLNISGRFKNKSIARLFYTAVSVGGKKLLDTMFRLPMTAADEINQRSSILKYFTINRVVFPFTGEEVGVMENYLGSAGGGVLTAVPGILYKRFLKLTAQEKDYDLLNGEVSQTIALLKRFYQFLAQQQDEQHPYYPQLRRIKGIYTNTKLGNLLIDQQPKDLPLLKLIRYDHLLRIALRVEMQQLLEVIFSLDVFIAVAGIASSRGFCYAIALARESNELAIDGLYHPAVDNAVGNAVSLHQDSNVLFLTGANMAGKSTLMKSIGISVYLAHMGFPVAASSMTFSVKDGLFSSINLADNLALGYSHFYAEVLRVKTIAQQVAAGKDLVVIFDELFKGTNVKDAYDATLAITEAFGENRNCLFVISTHITEVGEALMGRHHNFRFVYLPTIMQGNFPQYTYMLTEGITADRHGMLIINNENILDIIRGN